MEIYRRKGSPYWMADVVHPVTGKRIRRSTKETDKRRAQRRLVELEEELRQQLGGCELTITQAVEQYVLRLESERRASAAGARQMMLKLLGLNPNMVGRHHVDGDRPLHSLVPTDVALLVTARQREGNAPQTIAHEVKLLRAACRYARELQQRAPAIDKWRMPTSKPKTRYLSPEEWRRVFDHLSPDRPLQHRSGATYVPQGHQYRARQDAQDLFVALSMTGGRWAEVARLTWDRVDTEGWAWVRIWGFKDREERLVGMPRQAREVLQRRWQGRVEGQVLIFPGRYGGSRGGSCRAILRAMEAAGLNRADIVEAHGRATVHSLRHTFASWLLQNGADLAEVQEALGHTTMAMTRRYAHLAKRKTAARLGALIEGVV